MNLYADHARNLQRGVRSDEAEQLAKGYGDYSEAEVKQAIVHARQDIVMLVSYLDSLNVQVKTIRQRLAVILIVLVLGFCVLMYPW